MKIKSSASLTAFCLGLAVVELAGRFLADGASAYDGLPGTEFAVPAPTAEEPVTAVLRVFPDQAGCGRRFEAVIRIRISSSHHIYATNEIGGPFAPTSVKLGLPPGVEARGGWTASRPSRAKDGLWGDWTGSKPALAGDGRLVYTNSAVFTRSLRVAPNASAGTLSIRAELRFQACSEEICRPPGIIELSAPLTIGDRGEPKP